MSAAEEAAAGRKEHLPIPPSHVVGIGASAGGLDAIEDLFREMPVESDAAFVVVQHLSPDFKSLMDEILARHTRIPIRRAEHEMPIEPNAIYLNPPKKNMIVSNGRLLLSDQEQGELKLPIDLFFKSLAAECRERAIAIVLSGTGSDGSRGIVDVHEAGGLVLLQEAGSAKFDGMPLAALRTKVADLVLTPDAMPAAIVSRMRNPRRRPEALLPPQLDVPESALGRIFSLLNAKFGIEFGHYRPTTVDRRLGRRLEMTGCRDEDEYIDFLMDNPAELDNLYRDLLIGVTRFYRDPEAFRELETKVIPQLFERAARESRGLRVWVPGCCTGEEAYSLAILLDEAGRRLGARLPVKIFATDVHQASLDQASAGLYGENAAAEISPERLESYFTRRGTHFQIEHRIRQTVLFAPQNVISDAPFTNLDLLVCRNMMIYFEPAVQRKVLSLFHFALKTGGVLFSGSSESVGDLDTEFETISAEWKIYRKKRDIRLADARPLPAAIPTARRTGTTRARSPRTLGPTDALVSWAYESLLGEFVDAGFLVDDQKNVLHIFGKARAFVQARSGRPSVNLLEMVSSEATAVLSASIHRARKERVTVEYKRVRMDTSDGEEHVTLTVTPLFNKRANTSFFFVRFREVGPLPSAREKVTFESEASSGAQVADLESELRYTKEHLQATNEELETANEELQATNEELVASNEELQSTNEELVSTNEELQSTNEELHSVNEELRTVNVEYQEKIDELERLNSDMDNLLTSTDIGVIFLDTDLCIRTFTPAISRAMHLTTREVGRPIEDVAHELHLARTELRDLAREVMESGGRLDREVRGPGEKWLMLRILPYLARPDRVEGVVMTFFDITEAKRHELERQRYTARLEESNQDLQDFAYVASHDLKAPLRAMVGFSDLLREACWERLSETERDQFDRITEGGRQMQTLINELLEFSRVHDRGAEFEPFDCTEALDRALGNLALEIEQSRAVVHRNLLPTLSIDRTQITQVFQNLIGNAIRFRGKEPPEVRVSAVHRDDEWVLSVKDNGIGIDPKHFDRIFVIFQRLGAPTDAPGTGMGLAICKRIAERHGGRIWVESQPGRGSEFFFSLPVAASTG